MAHLRQRYLRNLLTKGLRFSPLVGVLGHRQVGKTTLLQDISEEYMTFDDPTLLLQAQKTPKDFIQNIASASKKNPLTIDECQLAPEIFPVLKDHVRINKRPGQFLLSGSVRFSSKKAIRESLTGRILTLELLPFSLRELRHQPLLTNLFEILDSKNLENLLERKAQEVKDSLKLRSDVEKYLQGGGLPGLCFLREDSLRRKNIEEQMVLMLDRDLRTIHGTNLPYRQILDFVRLLAENEGIKIKHSVIRRKIGISEETQKHLLYTLEALFLIRALKIEGDSAGNVYYFEDQAEHRFLAPNSSSIKSFEGLFYRNLRIQLFYQIDRTYTFFKYQTRGGASVPIAIDIDGKKIGFIVIEEDEPTKSHTMSAHSFLRKYGNAKIVFVSTTVKKAQAHDDRSLLAPIEWFC